MVVIRHGRLGRVCAILTLIFQLFFVVGCSSWHDVPVENISPENNSLLNQRARFYENTRMWDIYVQKIEFPFVSGAPVNDRYGPLLDVDLRKITKIEVYGFDGTQTAVGVAVAVVAVAFLVVIFAAIVSSTSSTKSSGSGSSSSCPMLYVRGGDGTQRVGEAYAGAAFRSVQRSDLLPLPATDKPLMHCVFVNEATEIDHTDCLALVTVDHPAGTRAVSTFEQKAILVGDRRPPIRATDARGGDVTATVAREDGELCQTDWPRVLKSATPPVREPVTATFTRPTPGNVPVLELVLSNTYWLEMMMGQFFALTGSDFEQHMTIGNSPESGPRIRRWLEREGVSFTVECERDGRWEKVAVVPPTGPTALRRVAVPLPQADDGDPLLNVRVSGGTGFWQIDEMTLSVQSDAVPEIHEIAPANAVNQIGEDELALVTSVDGRYQVLENTGDRLMFDFEMPAVPADMERSAFLLSTGYYNVHAPAATAGSPEKLATMIHESGAFARFSIDTYRHYQEMVEKTPPRAHAVTEVRK
jgi:hypothetical protein